MNKVEQFGKLLYELRNSYLVALDQTLAQMANLCQNMTEVKKTTQTYLTFWSHCQIMLALPEGGFENLAGRLWAKTFAFILYEACKSGEKPP